MARISVIGAGPAGMIFAYACLRQGHEVTVYSNRTPEQWLNQGPPTGTAFHYGNVIDIERELGMDHWTEEMYAGDGVLLDFTPALGSDFKLRAAGRFEKSGAAIDQRMRVHRWLEDLEGEDGRLEIEEVSAERADEIAARSDLTVLAAGKGEIGRMIPRDPGRSVYDRPQRNLAMLIAQGVESWEDEAGFTPVKFNFIGDTGEFFWVPYTHKSGRHVWCVLFEAKAGGRMDRFGDVDGPVSMCARAKEVIAELAPEMSPRVAGMQPVEDDPFCWLKGRFPPTVRKAFGTTPAGRPVMPIGDTAMLFDPIGGQGGNNANRHAKFVADKIAERGDGPLDTGWMEATHEAYWREFGKPAYSFNNILLEPLTEAGQLVLSEAERNRAFADMFFSNFAHPRGFFPWIEDLEAAQRKIEDVRARAA